MKHFFAFLTGGVMRTLLIYARTLFTHGNDKTL